MPCSPDAEAAPARLPGLPLLVAMLLLALGARPALTADAPGAGFRVESVAVRLLDDVYRLDATIDFDFSDESLEALENGVPLTVVIDMEIMRERRFLDERVGAVSARYRIRKHALSGQYVVTNEASGEAMTYQTFREMRASLGRVTDFPMIDAHAIAAEEHYLLRLRVRLDIEALPSPLRPLAYLSSLWRLSSGWSEWPLRR
ncbi:MAG: DUF4390 domain-containing protein [Ectothiorhodospiraceae bacterium]|nr:DUF4390 domain-containing protein [Chromatiales bacterium]MCP5155056.1 DUF4390 domain-containing protein [Ectothiorhodospiraceae bacterium]